jgi:hypothetical protein
MSFSFQAAGKITDVIDQIKAHQFVGDTSQADTVKELILGELQQWNPDGYMRGVVVEASGHHESGSRNLNITMRPLHLKG